MSFQTACRRLSVCLRANAESDRLLASGDVRFRAAVRRMADIERA
jgi:hypothetical protein